MLPRQRKQATTRHSWLERAVGEREEFCCFCAPRATGEETRRAAVRRLECLPKQMLEEKKGVRGTTTHRKRGRILLLIDAKSLTALEEFVSLLAKAGGCDAETLENAGEYVRYSVRCKKEVCSGGLFLVLILGRRELQEKLPSGFRCCCDVLGIAAKWVQPSAVGCPNHQVLFTLAPLSGQWLLGCDGAASLGRSVAGLSARLKRGVGASTGGLASISPCPLTQPLRLK